jgi:hypothetical protein
LKCYVHQNLDAVGVCSTCGRGLCRYCVVRLDGRFYCKEDSEQVIAPARRRATAKVEVKTDTPRGIGVMLGSIFAYLLGGTALLVACMVIFAGMVSGGSSGGGLFTSLFSPDLSFLGPIQQYPGGTITTIGITMMVFGSFGIAAGFYTWRPSRFGAVMSIAFGVLGLIGGFELSSVAVDPLLVDAWFALSGLTIALAYVGLVQLTMAPTKVIASIQGARTYRRNPPSSKNK